MIVVLYLALAGALLLPGLISGPSLDAAVFTVTAGQVAHGDVLYVDAWDHKPPGIYLIYAAACLATGWMDPWPVVWLLSVATTAAIGHVVHRTALQIGVRSWPARLAGGVAVLVAGQYLFALGGGLTEPIAVLPAAVAFLLATDTRLSAARLVLIGLLVGVAALISLQLVIGAVIIGAMVVFRAETGHRLSGSLAGLAGAAVPVVAIGAWLLMTGALEPALDAVFGYAAAYRNANAAAGADLSGPVAAWSTLALVFLLVPAGAGALDARRRGGAPAHAALACLAWLALSVAAFVAQGRFIAHYAIPLAIPLGVLAGLGLDRLLARPRPLLVAPFVVALGISLVAGGLAGVMEWQSVNQQHRRAEAAGDYLRNVTDAADAILVWGNAPSVYLAAEREPATAYSFLYPLSTHGYSTEDHVAGLVRQLSAHPPAAIVDAGSDAPGEPGFLPLLEPRPVATDGRDLDLLDALRDFIRDHYHESAEIEGWPVYLLR